MDNIMRIDDNHGHTTSKDYEALFSLMQRQPVICIVDYSRGGGPHEKPCRDIASTLYSDYPSYQVSARGIGYIYAFSKDEFINQCSAKKLEWLVPAYSKKFPDVKPDAGLANDPICGNCFAPLSQHYHEKEIYCYYNTTGDIYKTEPPEDLMCERLADRYPALYQAVVDEWKRENGHMQDTN